MVKNGETDYSLLIAAMVAIVAIVGLVIYFKSAGMAGAANVILPQEVPTSAEPISQWSSLEGNKVAMKPEQASAVQVVGEKAAYGAYLVCRKNDASPEEQRECCSIQCETECVNTYGSEPTARTLEEQKNYEGCRSQWCEGLCRDYMWKEQNQGTE